MLTLYDRHYSTRYIHNEQTGNYDSKEVQPLNTSLRFNYFSRLGVSYSWDRFYLGLAGNYDLFSFRGTTLVSTQAVTTDITTTGHFSKWSAVLKFTVKF